MIESEESPEQLIRKLNQKQQRALETLLVGGSDLQAAETAKVNRATIAQWRTKLPSFIAALASARSDLLRRMTARLHAATTLAVRALEEVAKDTRNPSARVAAARVILEFSQRAIELQEIEKRLEELEAWFADYKKGLDH
jgi:S-adenosylmethionine:tRNA-ribosyltransferase-isomerase (queuine synthetase)